MVLVFVVAFVVVVFFAAPVAMEAFADTLLVREGAMVMSMCDERKMGKGTSGS